MKAAILVNEGQHNMSRLAQLRELKLALQEDLVTQDEYTEQRRAILTARKPSQAAVPMEPPSDSTAAVPPTPQAGDNDDNDVVRFS